MSDCTASRPVRPTVDALTLALDPLPKASAMVFDTGLRYLIVRGPALARQGFSAASVAGLLVADAPSAQRWAFYERRDRAALGGETGSVEVPSPDGKLWDLVEVGPLRAGDGEAIGGVSFAADVTERTQAEAGTAQLAAIVESTDDAVIALMLSAALAGGALRRRGGERRAAARAARVARARTVQATTRIALEHSPVCRDGRAGGEGVDSWEWPKETDDQKP